MIRYIADLQTITEGQNRLFLLSDRLQNTESFILKRFKALKFLFQAKYRLLDLNRLQWS